MTIKEFLDYALNNLENPAFTLLKRLLINEYIELSYVNIEDVTLKSLSEKLYDYFEKVELKTGDSVNVLLSKYMSSLKNLVGKRIPRVSRKKGEKEQEIARTRKYYDLACEIRYSKEPSFDKRVDYSRIILCLYMAEINSKDFFIEDFDFSFDSIDIDKVLMNMKSEKVEGRIGRRKVFDLSSKYNVDKCTMILTIIFFCYIKNCEDIIIGTKL